MLTPEECDELAKRFEEYEPSPEDERDPAALIALQRAAGQSGGVVAGAVAEARRAPFSWRIIGSVLGLNREAARRLYGDESAD